MNRVRKLLLKLLFPEYFRLEDWLHKEMFVIIGERLRKHDEILEGAVFEYLRDKYEEKKV